ncbi:aminomethyltransferase family protein [Desulfobulbus alkaliphilus]|uniref:aminomethyltransferase family protein n=1 Tax=Desulfobulbus alkaliphilus TaxID=869814 RepID=UPI0019639491|nr:aminomethyl transferase family protein [Desulfobulbus alkaliphilus]MBM9538736.1 aminomethyl transferase family protein [Desulfobulbus alkaliphilus]
MNTGTKTTPLHQWHLDAGAHMADFGGYDMPLWYATGVKNEHLAVLTSAGIFDTSHMACITVDGKDAFALLNYCVTRNLAPLAEGRCVYGAFLDEKGHCLDDALVYKFADTGFMVCVNAGMGESITAHLVAHANHKDVNIADLSGKIAKMDIQGVNAARILSSLIQSPEKVFDHMPYFSFKGHFDSGHPGAGAVKLNDGTPVLLSRSGYTGEFGFEIFLAPHAIVDLWQDVLTTGKDLGLTACGLGARDSLRAGACLPLSHQDIGHYKFINHPWDFSLPYTPDKTGFTKTFLGSDALVPEPGDMFVFPFAGNSLRKVAAGETTGAYDHNQEQIGHVLTCVTDMGITWHDGRIVSIASPNLSDNIKIKGIACGFVMVSRQLQPGTQLTLKEGKRTIDVSIVQDIRPDRTARKKLSYFI